MAGGHNMEFPTVFSPAQNDAMAWFHNPVRFRDPKPRFQIGKTGRPHPADVFSRRNLWGNGIPPFHRHGPWGSFGVLFHEPQILDSEGSVSVVQTSSPDHIVFFILFLPPGEVETKWQFPAL